MSAPHAKIARNVPNHLKDSASPYLQQHAYNPVQWYPWGEEALEKARKEDKPILVSIGYSTCYWCHVMERQVFENETIARQMNEHFINIKIDREERPDLDEIYMTATQIMTQHGGWPNNVFLTPDLKPFFAGTYFGPEDTHGRPGFPKVLQTLHDLWKNNRQHVLNTSEGVADIMRQVLAEEEKTAGKIIPGDKAAAGLLRYLHRVHDKQNGGFSLEPKFPQENNLLFLLEYYRQTNDADAVNMLEKTLGYMAAGGIHDHVGGGFHRYAVDEKWRVPHFEKMLYNQALISRVYTELFALSNHPYHRHVAEHTFAFVARQMTSEAGAFYSALDAETDAAEGAYYVWSEKELESLLSKEEKAVLEQFYTFEDVPHFSGHKKVEGKVLYARKPLPEAALEQAKHYEAIDDAVRPVMEKLLTARNKRPLPLLDDKVIAGWNGIMIDALARAGVVMDNTAYTRSAEKAADFILRNMVQDGRLFRVYAASHAYQPAYLEDYAFVVQGLVSLFKANGKEKYLQAAMVMLDYVDETFLDAVHGGYFFAEEKDTVLMRIKKPDDSSIPSGNAVLAHVCIDMYGITKDEAWLKKAGNILNAFAGAVERIPPQYSHMVQAALRLHNYMEKEDISMISPVMRQSVEDARSLSSESRVKTSAQVAAYDREKVEVVLTLEVASGWHINSARPAMDFLIPTKADMQPEEGEVENIEIIYPNAAEIPNPLTGGVMEVYGVMIDIRLLAAVKKAGSIIVRASYQACRDDTCLQPSESLFVLTIK